MRYAVIVCPACGKARGVESGRKTTACQCGKEIDVQKVKFQYETDSPMDLANAVAQANALILGGERLKKERRSKKKDPFAAVAEKAKVFKDPLERLKAVARELTSAGGDFGVEELKKVAPLLGRMTAEDMAARMLEHGIVYETADGRFRLV